MKALVISILILLVAFFSTTPAFGQPEGDKPAQPMEQKEEPVNESENKNTVDANTATNVEATADINSIADVNVAADPDAVRDRIEKFEGLSRALSNIDMESRKEISEWTRGRLDDRLELALAMQKQITTELKFLRELAVKEGAAETTAAIDGILLDRHERFKSVIIELEKNNERLRRIMEREERRNQQRERELRGNGRSRERPERSRKDMQ